ncbi:hypothetical protein RCL_jg3396.t1 [Rhizophagus clarus]|uniref:Uncharacterized protein n=1 Tax=Rhizophagus clarus TaxID=94130 RepID=A0A8H3MCQ7_9GLOM|nr:hypothetical protein RCL_jg3396.t1 [Rhizophagus clarus]
MTDRHESFGFRKVFFGSVGTRDFTVREAQYPLEWRILIVWSHMTVKNNGLLDNEKLKNIAEVIDKVSNDNKLKEEVLLSSDTVVETISTYRKNLSFGNTTESENENQIYGFAEVMTYHKEVMNAIRYSSSHGGRIPAREEKDDVWWETLAYMK